MLTNEHRTALASLRAIWPSQRIVIIGAGALRAQKRLPRFTADIDVALAVDLTEYPGKLQVSTEWTLDPKLPQRWVHQNGVPIDIIPAGDALLVQGHVTWPNDHRLNLEGFSALFSAALPFADPHLRIEMATVPLVVLLKMVAWLDRPADRARDLYDLAFLLTDYLDEHDDADFDRILDAIQHGHVEHSAANAFVLGQDVARCDGAGRVTKRFVHSLSTTHRWMLSEMQANGPATIGRDEAFDAVWQSFTLGLGIE